MDYDELALAVASEKLIEKATTVGLWLAGSLEEQFLSMDGKDCSFSLKFKGDSWLLITRVNVNNLWLVSFTSGGTALGSLYNFMRAAAAEKVKWKEDKYRNQ